MELAKWPPRQIATKHFFFVLAPNNEPENFFRSLGQSPRCCTLITMKPLLEAGLLLLLAVNALSIPFESRLETNKVPQSVLAPRPDLLPFSRYVCLFHSFYLSFEDSSYFL